MPFLYTVKISQFQQLLNNYVNFDFSIMKKLWNVDYEKSIDISRHGILDITMDVSLVP